jgi:hypothetical protein
VVGHTMLVWEKDDLLPMQGGWRKKIGVEHLW